MKINEEKLYSQYKLIQKTCLEDGTPIPYIISPFHIPEEHKFNFNELRNLNVNIEVLRMNERKRKREEYKFFNDKNKGLMIEYWEKEFKEFLNQYPQFQNILL